MQEFTVVGQIREFCESREKFTVLISKPKTIISVYVDDINQNKGKILGHTLR